MQGFMSGDAAGAIESEAFPHEIYCLEELSVGLIPDADVILTVPVGQPHGAAMLFFPVLPCVWRRIFHENVGVELKH